MTDDKAKMGSLIILNRHILILRRDHLRLTTGEGAIRQGFKGDKTLWSMCFSFSAPPERGVVHHGLKGHIVIGQRVIVRESLGRKLRRGGALTAFLPPFAFGDLAGA